MLQILKDRRSCRAYKSDAVEEEKIKEIISAGLYASNSRGQQNGIIIAVTNKDWRDKIAKMNTEIAGAGSDMFYGAPVILLVAVKKSVNAVYDGSTMIQNMLLEATNQGLGSCWIHRAKEEVESGKLDELFKKVGLDANDYIGVGHVSIGYPVKDTYPPKTIKDGREFWVK